MSRSLGWTLLTTRSPIEIVPEVMFSSPASMRSKVDLPQPDGPTSTTNSPSSIGMVTPCRTSNPPNDFRTSRICTDDISYLSSVSDDEYDRRCRPVVVCRFADTKLVPILSAVHEFWQLPCLAPA